MVTHTRLRVAVGGASWTLTTALLTIAAQGVFVAFSGRLLTPSEYGLFTAASLGLRFVSYFAQGGVTQALVQRQHLTERHLRAAGLVSLVISVVAAALTAITALPVALLLGTRAAAGPMAALAGAFPFSAFGSQATALLRRSYRFRAVAVTEIASYILAFPVCGVAAMAAGWGTWSLVLAALVQPLLTSVLQVAVVRQMPRFGLELDEARQLFRFGGLVSIIGFLEFLSGNADTAVVSRSYGAAVLGQYGRASSLVGVGLNALTTAGSKVLGPIMAKEVNHEDAGRMSMVATRLMIFPFAVGVGLAFVMSRDGMRVLLGPNWDLAAEILPWYTLGAALDLLCHFMAVALEARGMLREKLRMQLQQFALVVALVGTTAATTRSPKWIATAWAGAEAWRLARYAFAARRLMGQPVRPIVLALAEGIFIGGVVYGATALAAHALTGQGSLVRVVASGAVALILTGTYLAIAPGAPWPSLVRNLMKGGG